MGFAMVLWKERGGQANGEDDTQRGTVLRALHQAESGERVEDVCCEHGVSEATFYVWKKKYSGLALNELRELRQLREENGKLKRLGRGPVSGPAHAPADRAKKAGRPRHRRELGQWTQAVFSVSTRRVSGLMMVNRATMNYRRRRDPQTALKLRLRELAATRVRFGYRRLTVMLRPEGWAVNAKRIYRLYTADGLAVRTKVRQKSRGAHVVPVQGATRPNEKWSMDFCRDALTRRALIPGTDSGRPVHAGCEQPSVNLG
jgi:transposase-like protein